MRRLAVACCVVLLGIGYVGAKPPNSKKAALKVLNLLKEVDGAGSGLDADTLQGMTPAQLQAGAVGADVKPPVVRDANGKLVGALVGTGAFNAGVV